MDLTLRKAKHTDLEAIVSLLANDAVAAKREDDTLPLNQNYTTAFNNISKDPNQYLMVVEDNQKLIGTFHMTLLPSLTYTGKAGCLSKLCVSMQPIAAKALANG